MNGRKEWLQGSGFPERLRAARVEKGWSLRKAEQEIGMKNGDIDAYELGKKVPSVMIAAKLAKAYDTSLDWLVFGADWLEGE